MNPVLFEALEHAIRDRNPILAQRLRPGRSEVANRRSLARAGVMGCVDPVVALFCWKNGSNLDPSVPLDKASPFPKSGYYLFMPLSFILGHFQGFREFAKHCPSMKEVAGRYFPLFWNGSTGWLAVDLKPASNSRVVLIESQADDPVLQVYPSFDDFMTDAIRANRENTSLKCF